MNIVRGANVVEKPWEKLIDPKGTLPLCCTRTGVGSLLPTRIGAGLVLAQCRGEPSQCTIVLRVVGFARYAYRSYLPDLTQHRRLPREYDEVLHLRVAMNHVKPFPPPFGRSCG